MYTEIISGQLQYAEPTYSNLLTISSLYSNGSSDSITNANADSIISAGAIGFGQTTMNVLKVNQNMQSEDFETGVSGWQIKGDGDVEFNNGVFRGAITATTIDIGGADTTSFHVDINGNMWLGAATLAAAPFKVTSAGAVTASNLTITGGTGVANLSDAGNLAVLDAVGAGNCDTTIISGGKIITGLLTASNIQTGTLNANLITVQNFTVGTNVNIGTAFPTASAGDMAYEDLVSAAKLDTTVIVGGYIKTSLLTANNITTGTLSAVTVQSGTGNEKIVLDNGDYIRYYSGGTLRASTRGTTLGSGGIYQTGGDYFIGNNRSYWIADTTGGSTKYGGLSITNANECWITMGTANIFIVKNNAQDTNYLTVTSTYTQVPAIVFSTGEYIDSNAASNDMRYYAGDQHEFYVGSTIKAIIDENIWTAGNLLADGTKPFLIKHPDGSDRYLRYTAQESPEVILRHRGKSKTDINGKIDIILPKHFTLITEQKGDVTVNLTSIGNHHIFLQEEPTNSLVKVESSEPNVNFHYEVIAIRKGYLNSPIELDVKDKSLSEMDSKMINNINNIKNKLKI
jgi:hypothetical protein